MRIGKMYSRVHENVRGVVQEEDDCAGAHVVVGVRAPYQHDRDKVVHVHHHIVLVALLDEAVPEARVNPDRELHEVEEVHGHVVRLAVRMGRPV
eukprot:scaffold24196_cov72-Phaeocystis_antarctica.AAC.2